jgi:ribosome maturation factor RimP
VGNAGEQGVSLLVGKDVRHVKYQDIAHAVVEVEFREAPAAEIAMLENEEGSR